MKTSGRRKSRSSRQLSEADPPTVGCVLFLVFEVLVCIPPLVMVFWALYYAGGLAWDGSHKQFNWHPVCMTLCVSTFLSNGIVAFRIFPFHRRTRKALHAVIHLMVLLIAAIGLVAVFQNHQKEHISHLYSLHSWCGLSVVCLVLTQWIGGAVSFVLPILSGSKRASFKPWHVRIGHLIYFLAIATCLIGINEKMSFLGNHTHKRSEFVIEQLDAHAHVHEPVYRYSDLPAQAILSNMVGLVLMFISSVVFTIASRPDYTSGDKMRGFRLVSSS